MYTVAGLYPTRGYTMYTRSLILSLEASITKTFIYSLEVVNSFSSATS
jgi:hypothetical protein